MGYFDTTSVSPSRSEMERDVVFLGERGLTEEFLYKEKILPENADIHEFVREMREVESRAESMGVRLTWTCEKGNSMARVTPDQASNTIFFNLRTLTFDSKHKNTLSHEFKHLLQQRVTGDAYHPPGLEKLSPTARRMLYKASGMVHLSTRDVLEGFVEGSTARVHGENQNVAYTHLQVPEVKKLDQFVQEKTGVSLLACYVEMTVESMSRFEAAIKQTANQVLLEEAATSLTKRSLNSREIANITLMAQKLTAEGKMVQDREDATNYIMYTEVSQVDALTHDIRMRTVSRIPQVQSSNIVLRDVPNFRTEPRVNILGMVWGKADRVVRILQKPGRNNRTGGVVLSA